MFKDIMQKFGLEHHCHIIFPSNSFVVYEIKHIDHSEICKHFVFPY